LNVQFGGSGPASESNELRYPENIASESHIHAFAWFRRQ
jgi:hypothetical protein